jgi:His-Xaa-Ser system protein HxsD
MILQIDRNIYSDSCISKVVYWLSDQYTIERRMEGCNEILQIEGVADEHSFKNLFFEKLNDFKLRGIIENETKDIRTILYAKAFGDFDDITEEVITE